MIQSVQLNVEAGNLGGYPVYTVMVCSHEDRIPTNAPDKISILPLLPNGARPTRRQVSRGDRLVVVDRGRADLADLYRCAWWRGGDGNHALPAVTIRNLR